jgi:hypothetical protein
MRLGAPTITRVDITENLGTRDAEMTLRHLSTYMHHGKTGYLYPNGQTVDWNGGQGAGVGGSRRVYIKYYVKSFDLCRKIRVIDKKEKRAQSHPVSLEYARWARHLREVRGFADKWHMIRHEVSFKAPQLERLGLQSVGRWEYQTMGDILRPYQFHKRLNVEQAELTDVSGALLRQGVKAIQARRAELVLRAWLQGGDVRKAYSQAQYYRWRALLLKVGVDISQPCNIAHLPLRAIKSPIASVPPPRWYQLPRAS